MTKDSKLAEIAHEIAEQVKPGDRWLVVTGAGISAESGLPTYRGPGGLYNQRLTEDAVGIQEALSGQMFHAQPRLTWKYLSQVEQAARHAQPNLAHRVLADLESILDVSILTQNVDGLHTDAGSTSVLEIHGSLRQLRCLQCCVRMTVRDYGNLAIPPICDECSGLMRPDVVLFGEPLPPAAIAQYRRWLTQRWDMVMAIGTQCTFGYVAQLITRTARQGTPTMEINPEPTVISGLVTYRFDTAATQAMKLLKQAVNLRMHRAAKSPAQVH